MGITISPGVQYGAPFQAILAPGAGRYRDYCFPEPGYVVANLTQQVSGQRQGNGGEAGPTFARALYTADPGTPPPFVYNGVNTLVINATAGPAGQSFCFGCLCPRLAPSFITTDDCAVTRMYWIMAINQPPANANTDFGGYVMQVNSATPDMRLIAGIPGFGFQYASMSIVNFRIQGPNGLITIPLTAAPFDCSLLHIFELRLIPSTSVQWAFLQAFIDSVPVSLGAALNSSWAPGTNLPPLAISGGKLAFGPGVINNSLQGVGSLLLQQLRVISAPTFQDLF